VRSVSSLAQFESNLQDIVNNLNNVSTNFTLTLSLGNFADLILPTLLSNVRVQQSFTIEGVIDEPKGKWPIVLGSVQVLEPIVLVNQVKNALLSAFDSLADFTNIPIPIPITFPFGISPGPITVNLHSLVTSFPGLSTATRQQLNDSLLRVEEATAQFRTPAFP